MGTTVSLDRRTPDVYALVHEIQPQLPDGYPHMGPQERQKAVDRVRNALTARRNVLELVSDQRKQRGLIMQHEAEAAAVRERLQQEELVEHRRKHLLGRLLVCESQAERSRQLIDQYQMEIELYQHLFAVTE